MHRVSGERAGGGPLSASLGFLRYGRGLYFSKTSSKSHDYGGETERVRGNEPHRVMFLCKVALGEQLRGEEVERPLVAYRRRKNGNGRVASGTRCLVRDATA